MVLLVSRYSLLLSPTWEGFQKPVLEKNSISPISCLSAIMALVQKISKRDLKKQSDEHMLRELAEVNGLFEIGGVIG